MSQGLNKTKAMIREQYGLYSTIKVTKDGQRGKVRSNNNSIFLNACVYKYKYGRRVIEAVVVIVTNKVMADEYRYYG